MIALKFSALFVDLEVVLSSICNDLMTLKKNIGKLSIGQSRNLFHVRHVTSSNYPDADLSVLARVADSMIAVCRSNSSDGSGTARTRI